MNHTANRRNLWLTIVIAILIVAISVLDIYTPRGLAIGTLYVLPTALSLWLPWRKSTFIIGTVNFLLVIIGYLVSPPSPSPVIFSLINRGLSLVAITTLVIIGMRPRAAEYFALMLQKKHAEELLKEIEARAFRNLRLVAQLKWVSRTAAIVVMVIGSVVLFGGWVFGNPGLQSLVLGLPKMMPNTAFGLLLLAVSLFLHNSTLQERWRAGWIGRFLAAAVAGLGIVTIAEYLLGINLGIDELLFRDSSPGATYPGRPSPQTSLAFALAGASLLLQGSKRLWVLCTGQVLGLIVGFITIGAGLGYMHASVTFYGVTPYTGMAVHTIFGLLILSLGIVFAKPDRGLVPIFTSNSAGGLLMRRLLPIIIVILVGLSILSGWGERKGLYSANFGIVLFDTLYIAVQVVVLWFFAAALQRAEASRRQVNEALENSFVQIEANNRALEQTQAELRRLNEQLEQRVKERTADLVNTNERLEVVFESVADGIVIGDLSGVIVSVNSKTAELVGYSTREELIGKTFFDFIIAREHEEVKVQMQKVLELGEAKGVCFTLTRKDGSLLQVEVSAGSLKNALGSPTGLTIVIRDITERIQAEKENKRLQQQNEMILNSAGEGIYGVDLEGKTTFVNPIAAKLVGYESAELIGKVQHALIHHTRSDGTPYPQEQCSVYAAFTDGTTHHVGDEVFWRKDGMSFPVEYTSTPTRNERGELVGAVVVFNDITERKKMEEETRKLSEAVEATADIIFITDNQGVFQYVNPAFEAATGYKEEEVIGKTPRIIKSGKQDYNYYKRLWETILAGGVIRAEVVNQKKNGELFHVEQTVTPIKNSAGNITHFISTNKDITERMQSENERTRQSNYLELLKNVAIAINESTSHEMALQCILDETCQKLGYAVGHFFSKTKGAQTLTSSGIWHLDDPERFKVFREVTESFHFAPNEGLPGRVFYSRKSEWIADVTQDSNFPRVKVGVDIGIKCGFAVPVFAGAEVEAVMEFFSPETKAIDETMLKIAEQVGTQLGRAFERKRAEEDRVKALEQLLAQDRLASVGQLVAGITHEIKNPLTSVIGFSDLLLQNPATKDFAGDLKIINDEAKRTVDIINNLLTFARKQPEGKAEIQINELVKRVIALRAHDHKGHNIHVVSHLAPDLPAVMGNSSQILQVFFNLVVNAEQAMLEVNNKGTLTITTGQSGDIVRVSIADDGPGINPENMKKLFVPFFTTKPVGKGNGLGLSTCNGIVTEHGGKIWAESKPGKGATFIIELPTVLMAFDI